MPAANFVQTAQGDMMVATQAIQNNTARYDTYVVLAAAAMPVTIPFFEVPRNQAGSGFARVKSYAETNMAVARQLENPVAMDVRRIIVSVIPYGSALNVLATMNVVKNVLEDSIVRFTVSDTLYYEIHLLWCGGTGITGMIANGGAADGFVGAYSGIAGREDLQIPIPIRSRENFKLEIIRNTNNTLLDDVLPSDTNLRFRVYLEGVIARPIDA